MRSSDATETNEPATRVRLVPRPKRATPLWRRPTGQPPRMTARMEDNPVTSVPEITRMIARIEDWKGQGPVLGRAEAARRLEEAHKLFEEIADMLTHMRRDLLGGR